MRCVLVHARCVSADGIAAVAVVSDGSRGSGNGSSGSGGGSGGSGGSCDSGSGSEFFALVLCVGDKPATTMSSASF